MFCGRLSGRPAVVRPTITYLAWPRYFIN